MDWLCRYIFGPLLLTFILIGVFETINPKSWPKEAVGGEVLVSMVICLLCLQRTEAKEKEQEKQEAKRREEEAARTEMEKFQAELRSKEQVDLEKHRLTLEAQRPKQEAVS